MEDLVGRTVPVSCRDRSSRVPRGHRAGRPEANLKSEVLRREQRQLWTSAVSLSLSGGHHIYVKPFTIQGFHHRLGESFVKAFSVFIVSLS